MTVSFPGLGQTGRLGNQLFQIAATIGHALRHETLPQFPIWERSYAFNAPESWFVRRLTVAGDPHDPGWNYAPLPYWDDIALAGYLQSPRYWDGYESLVREYLTPRWVTDRDERMCTVHVRRGDYLELSDHHPAPSLEWYEEAMRLAREAGAESFTVCSDDPHWCQKQPLFAPHTVSHATELFDLALMVASPYHVIANSTFSWWGAYLDPEPRFVVKPKTWFGPALAELDASQLDVPGWHAL